MLKSDLGFDVVYTDKPEFSADLDVVIAYAIPHYNLPHFDVTPFVDLDPRTKLVVYPRELFQRKGRGCEQKRTRMFARANIIMSYSKSYFNEEYSYFKDKFVYMPDCFASHERYASMRFNKRPIKKCLLTGDCHPRIFPLRYHLLRKRDEDQVVYQATEWGRNHIIAKGEYAKLLHSYYCGFTCTTKFKMAIAKHFEIPASGSLLMTDRCDDLDELGFIPYDHYIPVTKDDTLDWVAECLKNPRRYKKTRKNAMKFVRSKHSVINRYQEFVDVILSRL
jgi:hypothetical protein